MELLWKLCLDPLRYNMKHTSELHASNVQRLEHLSIGSPPPMSWQFLLEHSWTMHFWLEPSCSQKKTIRGKKKMGTWRGCWKYVGNFLSFFHSNITNVQCYVNFRCVTLIQQFHALFIDQHNKYSHHVSPYPYHWYRAIYLKNSKFFLYILFASNLKKEGRSTIRTRPLSYPLSRTLFQNPPGHDDGEESLKLDMTVSIWLDWAHCWKLAIKLYKTQNDLNIYKEKFNITQWNQWLEMYSAISHLHVAAVDSLVSLQN